MPQEYANTEELKKDLFEAGKKYDGHVTHGSLDELLKVVVLYIAMTAGKAYVNGFKDGELAAHKGPS